MSCYKAFDYNDTETYTRCDNPGVSENCLTCVRDISPDFKLDPKDTEIIKRVVKLDKTPEAIKYFARKQNYLTDYAYWFLLSTLWVSYTGFSELELWIKLFSSNKPNKLTSIMKPSELFKFEKLPSKITAYRVHRPNETNWIAYTLSLKIAQRFAKDREVDKITRYTIDKKDVLALFLRRGEEEIIVLDQNKARFVSEIKEVGIKNDN